MLVNTVVVTSNVIIAGNGRVLTANMFIVWLYLFKKYIMLKNVFFFPCDALCDALHVLVVPKLFKNVL